MASVQIISNDYGNLPVTLDTDDDFPRNAEPLGDLDGNGVIDVSPIPHDLATECPSFSPEGYLVCGSVLIVVVQSSRCHASHLQLAIGCRLDASKHGAVYILFLVTDFTAKSVQKISRTYGNLPYTLEAPDLFGVATGSLGDDLDGDGRPMRL